MDGYLGTILPWAGTYAPANWMFCNGQLLQIDQYSALFAVIGTQFGGDGRTNFALPDLRGRIPIGAGQGAGLTNHVTGHVGGTEAATLTTAQMPMHNHPSSGIPASTKTATAGQPGPAIVPGSYEKTRGEYYNIYSPQSDADTTLAPGGPTGTAGGNQPHTNMQPYLTVNYIICVSGLFPPHN